MARSRGASDRRSRAGARRRSAGDGRRPSTSSRRRTGAVSWACRSAASGRGRLRRRSPRRDHRDVGAGPCGLLAAGDHVSAAGQPSASRCTCSSTPRSWRRCVGGSPRRAAARGAGRDARHAWLAVVRNYERMLTGDLTGAREWARRAIEIGRSASRRRAIGRVAEARLLILDGDVTAGPGAARRGGGGHGLRRPGSPLDRGRLLRARVRLAGTRAIRPGRGVDRGDGAVVRDQRHRQPARSLPGPPRRDPPAARVCATRPRTKPSLPARSFGRTCDASWDGR